MIRRKLINRDAMNGVSRNAVATAMVNVFDRLQGLRNEVQLLAIAGAMALMTEVVDVSPQDSMTAVKNLMVDPKTSTRRELRFQAMKFHLETELSQGVM
jgi:hypothetical protein